MYFLVHFGILRDDESVQLAYENRIVPLPDVWWQSDAHANAYPDSNTDAYSNSDTYTNAYSNSNADAGCAERAEQSGWKCCRSDSDQSVVDG